MPLQIFQDPTLLLQTTSLVLSIFNLIAFLWLACTVWLNGDRRSMIARVGVVGLSFSALFFFIHALLISGPLSKAGIVSKDILWRFIWVPALVVPYIWFMIGLHYASLMNEKWERRRPILLICSAVLGCSILLLLIINRPTFTFRGTLLLLAYNDIQGDPHLNALSPLILLPILFLCYVTFCAIGPWFTPDRVARMATAFWQFVFIYRRPVSLRRKLADAFWNDQCQVAQLEEPVLSWYLARPILLLAALLMLCLTTSLGILGISSVFNWLHLQMVHRLMLRLPVADIDIIPLNLMLVDIYATGCVALIILLIGYSIVRHGILIERPLARRGFFEQWRGIVIMATTIALFIAILILVAHGSLGALLLITSIATGTYALFTWGSYTAHDRYLALLKPFLRSTSVRRWLNTDLQKTEQGMETLFSHLCKDVLEVSSARLIILAGPLRRSFNYRWSLLDGPENLSLMEKNGTGDPSAEQAENEVVIKTHSSSLPSLHKQMLRADFRAYRIQLIQQGIPIIFWVLPIYDELGLVAKLYLGPRLDGGIFTNEDMELAQACGQRILDTLRDHEAMMAVSGLLRRRTVDVKLLGAQQRRVLHDEILPQLHLALLRLETARSLGSLSGGVLTEREERSEQALNEAIGTISSAHRQLAAMMRAMSTGAPHRLERDGLMYAIHTMLEQDFQNAFDYVEWNVTEETASAIDDIVPPALTELIFAAVQEALRNAARHARGTDLHRRLRLTFSASYNPNLEVIVADDGIGVVSPSSSTTGTGGGLLTHSALLAIAGGSLTVETAPGEGVKVHIFLPIDALR